MARRAKSRSGGRRRRARSRRRGGVISNRWRSVLRPRVMSGRKRRGGFSFGNILRGALMGGLSQV